MSKKPKNQGDFIEIRSRKNAPVFVLKGEWTVHTAAAAADALEVAIKQAGGGSPAVDATGIERLDTAGAWLIRERIPGIADGRLTERQKALLDFLPPRGGESPPAPKRPPAPARVFIHLGKSYEGAAGFAYGILAFTGAVFIRLAGNFAHPRRFRLPSITRHIHETGIRALPIIGLLAFGISMVTSYQGAIQLRKFGADIFTIDLTVISLLREMGALVTAIMIAGRSGSAFAAEIGVMKLREEVDALRVIGLDPLETLVLPRLLALLVTLPILTFYADMVGLAGGGLMAQELLGISFGQYFDRVDKVATPVMFFTGMIKAPVFALVIALICTYQGMKATGSAESVGRLTTLAVVQSIFAVIMADAAFSILFAWAGI